MKTVETGEPLARSAGARRWSFATAQFDEACFELRVSGQAVALERKSLEVMLQLLYRAGEVVTKEELLEAVWPGRIVSESVPAKCVSRIREVLGDDEQEIIKTVHGYGYRLAAAVTLEQTRSAPAIARLNLAPGGHPPLRPLWSLVRRLGSGGQGEVWLVRHDKTGEERVYKFALDASGLTAIKREITLSRVLSNSLGPRDWFVRIFDWNLEEAPYFIELEYAREGNLETWAAALGSFANLGLGLRLDIVARIAEALAAAHSVGVLHKDLKPSNVLVATEPDQTVGVRLTDFGSGSVLDPQRLEALGITRLGFTQSVAGAAEAAATALYLAPECMTGQPATVKADVYALGILLYQAVIGDFKQPLAAGWEHRVEDPLLRDDIALAVAGDPARRLADAAQLATRLRTLDERRRRAEAEADERTRLRQEQQAAVARAREAELALERLRARRNGMLTTLAALVVGLALSLGLYFEARRAWQAANASASAARAVTTFLSKDLFAVVGEKPLRDLTVEELLQSASTSLENRDQDLPEVSAQLHAALGNAFFAIERIDAAERHLAKALARFEDSGEATSEAALAGAAQLLTIQKGRLRELPVLMPRYEDLLKRASDQLGKRHPAVLRLKEPILFGRYLTGDWRQAAADLAALVEDQRAAGLRSGIVERLSEVLMNLGQFDAALKVAREAVARLSSDPATSPLALAVAYSLLARTLIELEQFDAAEQALLSAETLITSWAVRGPSMYMLTVDTFRGLLRLRQGRAREARQLLEKTLNSLSGLDWVKATDALVEPRVWLARAYAETGETGQAQSIMQKALEISESQWGRQHPLSQGVRIALADLVLPLNVAGARQVIAAVDHETLASLAPDHPYVAELRRLEGLLALADGRRPEAQRALGEALRIFQARYGAGHSLTMRARSEHARSQGTPVSGGHAPRDAFTRPLVIQMEHRHG